MKTLLVPTDFSEEAAHAFRYAIEMASLTDSRIILLHVFYQPLSFRMGSDYAAAVNAVEQEKTRYLQAYANKIRLSFIRNFSIRFKSKAKEAAVPTQEQQTPTEIGFHTVEVEEALETKANVDVRCVAKYGFAIDEILKACDVQCADLVVMGMRGAGAITQAFLGSSTLALMQKAAVPVLAVPQAALPFKGIASLVFTLDLNKVPDAETLLPLQTLAALFKAKLHVLHLYHSGLQQLEKTTVQHAMQLLDTCFQELDYEVHFKDNGDIAAGIKEFAEQVKADLLVLVPQQHTFLERLLRKSITGKLAAKAFAPILALPSHAVQLAVSASAEEVV